MIDWQRVNELREEVGDEDFEEVVEIFLEEVDETVESLRANGRSDDLEEILHFLKGSALNLGFKTFSLLCQQGEQSAAAGQGDTVDLSKILGAYDESRSTFIQQYPNDEKVA